MAINPIRDKIPGKLTTPQLSYISGKNIKKYKQDITTTASNEKSLFKEIDKELKFSDAEILLIKIKAVRYKFSLNYKGTDYYIFVTEGINETITIEPENTENTEDTFLFNLSKADTCYAVGCLISAVGQYKFPENLWKSRNNMNPLYTQSNMITFLIEELNYSLVELSDAYEKELEDTIKEENAIEAFEKFAKEKNLKDNLPLNDLDDESN